MVYNNYEAIYCVNVQGSRNRYEITYLLPYTIAQILPIEFRQLNFLGMFTYVIKH